MEIGRYLEVIEVNERDINKKKMSGRYLSETGAEDLYILKSQEVVY